MNIYFLALLIIILVDGLKMLVELFRVKPLERKKNDYSKISVIMSAYNEEKMIARTLKSFIKNGFNPEHIFVCDDGSTDKTAKIVEENFPEVNLFVEKNRGKANSIEWLLGKVKTKFVFIVDADVVLEDDFYIPLWKLEEEKATGIAFNIVPYNKPRNILKSLVVGLQSLEYAKSMLIGKQSQNKTMSVSCISGAAGLFITKRMKKLSSVHSGNFSGEDLQRTLIELLNDGNVIFSDSVVFTDVPENFVELSKQRIIGWWSGLYHCFPLFIKVFFFRKSPIILRYEVLYDMVALITDPIKIWFFAMVLLSGNLYYLLFLYLVYFLLELVIVFFIREKFITPIGKILLVTIYPFYAFAQMFYRVFAFVRFVYHRFITKKIKPLKKNLKVAFTILAVFATLLTQGQSRTAEGNVGLEHTKNRMKVFSSALEYNRLFYSDNQKQTNNLTYYLGFKKIWWEGSFITDPRQTIGYYIPKGLIWVRRTNNDWQAYINKNVYTSKGILSGLNITYQQIYRTDTTVNRNISVLGMELEKYISDYDNIIVSVRKEWGRRDDVIGLITYNHKKNNYRYRIGAGVNNFMDFNMFVILGYKNYYLTGTHFEKFDYNNFNRSSLGLGVKF